MSRAQNNKNGDENTAALDQRLADITKDLQVLRDNMEPHDDYSQKYYKDLQLEYDRVKKQRYANTDNADMCAPIGGGDGDDDIADADCGKKNDEIDGGDGGGDGGSGAGDDDDGGDEDEGDDVEGDGDTGKDSTEQQQQQQQQPQAEGGPTETAPEEHHQGIRTIQVQPVAYLAPPRMTAMMNQQKPDNEMRTLGRGRQRGILQEQSPGWRYPRRGTNTAQSGLVLQSYKSYYGM